MPDVRWGLTVPFAGVAVLARHAAFVLTAICPPDALPGAIRALARRG